MSNKTKEKKNDFFGFIYKNKFKKAIIDLSVLYSILTMYMAYDGRSSEINLQYISEIMIVVLGFSIMWPFFSIIIQILTHTTSSYNLEFHLFLDKYDKEKIEPVTDRTIIEFIKRKYNFFLISLSILFSILIDDAGYLFINHIITTLIVFIILKVLFLNNHILRRTKTFNKYREMFKYKEEDINESKFHISKFINTIIFISMIVISSNDLTYPYNRIIAGIVLFAYIAIRKLIDPMIDKFYDKYRGE